MKWSECLVLIEQILSLLWTQFSCLLAIMVQLPMAMLNSSWTKETFDRDVATTRKKCTFYEGEVTHVRRRPVQNSFKYRVRMAVINLDDSPGWFRSDAGHYLSAAQAREMTGLKGEVYLLTNPSSAGYEQNPISVYYCYTEEKVLEMCIAEVTNTPWGERVTFLFRPREEEVPKALHVSPFMDMKNVWHLKTIDPGEKISLSVTVTHPEYGAYFDAYLTGRVCSKHPTLRNEEASLETLWRYGFMPQRVALLIYWQAVKLVAKGCPVYGPPDVKYRGEVEQQAKNPRGTRGSRFVWRDAQQWPWNQ